MYTRADVAKVFRLSANESVMQQIFSMENFYPNVCHVCLYHDREKPLKRCKGCQMISYCSKDHQKKHWPLHKDLCKAVSKNIMQGMSNQSNIFGGAFSNPKIQNFMMCHFPDMLQAILGRELTSFEYRMTVHLKVCEICRLADPDLLKACPKCPYANFCKKHEGDPSHEELCPLYILCLKMDIYDLVLKSIQPTDAIVKNTLLLTELTRLPSSISDIMESYFKLKEFIILFCNEMQKFVKHINFDLLRNEEYFEGFFIHTSELFTRSLTLIYAMEKINFPQHEKMVVHVIGSDSDETGNLSEWELLLHWLPFLKNLTIVFVEPALSQPEILPILCPSCMLAKNKLNFEFHSSLYKTYVINSGHIMPDIIVGYNTGISDYKTWPDSIAIMENFNCPLILTTFKELEAYQDQKVVNSILGAKTCLFLEKNPFASLRPFRYVDVNGGLRYCNINLLIYNNFQKMSTKIKLPFMEAAKDSKDQDELSYLASSLSFYSLKQLSQ